MNFIFISPNYPHTYWNFCERLKRNGMNVLGIGDAYYDGLEENLRKSLTEYYKVDSLLDYNQVYRAVAYFAFKYGKIDYIESLNEFWLENDARLRTDFNVNTGLKTDRISFIKKKSLMKEIYRKGGIPSARQSIVTDLDGARAFIGKTGYPVIVKPDVGVGATDTYRIDDDDQLETFISSKPSVSYVMEEFVKGDIYSYDAIVNSRGLVIFENMTCWPPSIMDIVVKGTNLDYYTSPVMDSKLRTIGRKTISAFDVRSRFVHLEFFRLDEDKDGLGKKGDFVGLEVNMRPAGGYTPDMMNWAHSTDVYQIYADMIVFDESRFKASDDKYYCVYAGRKDNHDYVHSHEQIMERYGDVMMMHEELPEVNRPQMGHWLYTVRLKTKKEARAFIEFVNSER